MFNFLKKGYKNMYFSKTGCSYFKNQQNTEDSNPNHLLYTDQMQIQILKKVPDLCGFGLETLIF